MKLVCLRIEDEGEDDTRAERSVNPYGKGLGNTDGTRVESSGSERHYRLESQAVRFSGSGQNLGEGRGSGHFLEPGMELGRDLVPTTGLGLNSRVNQCPESIKRARLNGLILHEPTCFKAQAEILKTGLSQDLFPRPVETTDSSEPISNSPEAGRQEGNAIPHGEEEELSEVTIQVEGHNLKNKYDVNLFDQSTPIPFSVFGRPLLSGGFFLSGRFITGEGSGTSKGCGG